MTRGERERLVAAVAKVAAEQGYGGLSVASVARRAGVTEEVYEAHFASAELGLLAAQDEFFQRLALEAASACGTAVPWPLRVKRGLRAVLSTVSDSSALARVFAVEAGGPNLALGERQFAALNEFARMLRKGREHIPATTSLPASTERLLVGGVASVVSECLLMEEPGAIASLEAELVELVLAPYLGEAEARRIAGS